MSKNQNAPMKGIETDEGCKLLEAEFIRKNQNAPMKGIETGGEAIFFTNTFTLTIQLYEL